MSCWSNENNATLGEVIAHLQTLPPDMVVAQGFAHPHSYRGYYEDLAFEPAGNVTVKAMLADAERALGSVFTGYKGGDYTMDERTDCWLASYGDTGIAIVLPDAPMPVAYVLPVISRGETPPAATHEPVKVKQLIRDHLACMTCGTAAYVPNDRCKAHISALDALQTEQEQHAAWRKRSEQAEAELAALRVSLAALEQAWRSEAKELDDATRGQWVEPEVKIQCADELAHLLAAQTEGTK